MIVDVEELASFPIGLYVRQRPEGQRFFARVTRSKKSYASKDYKHPVQALVALCNLNAELDRLGIQALKRGRPKRRPSGR